MNSLHAYGVLIKPKEVFGMLMLYISSYLSSIMVDNNSSNIGIFLTGLIAVTIGVSGANIMNNYLDRDIDSLMVRTYKRRAALNVAGTEQTRGVSLILISIASGISLNIGIIAFALFLSGLVFYLGFYTALLKRRTMINVFLTAPSVASPVWFGWYLGGAPIYPAGLLLGFLVALWGPLHIWSLAYSYAKDYRRADIPMLPVVKPKETAIKTILSVLLAVIFSSYIIAFFAKSIIYVVGVNLVNLLLLAQGIKFWRNKTKKEGYLLFKLTAPYLVLILLIFTIDQFIA